MGLNEYRSGPLGAAVDLPREQRMAAALYEISLMIGHWGDSEKAQLIRSIYAKHNV